MLGMFTMFAMFATMHFASWIQHLLDDTTLFPSFHVRPRLPCRNATRKLQVPRVRALRWFLGGGAATLDALPTRRSSLALRPTPR